MAKEQVAGQEALGTAMNKTEFFFEKNGKLMSYIFLGLLILAALIFGYRTLIVQPRAEKAAEMIAQAQTRFEAENPDYELALNGDANGNYPDYDGYRLLYESSVRTPEMQILIDYAKLFSNSAAPSFRLSVPSFKAVMP